MSASLVEDIQRRVTFEDIAWLARQPAPVSLAAPPQQQRSGEALTFEDIARLAREAASVSQAAAPVAPSGPVAPATPMQSIGMGAADPLHGGAQLLARSLPSGVVGAVNDAAAWMNRQPVLGPVTRTLGMTPATPEQLDRAVAQREADYQAARRAAGETGFDWGRLAGAFATGLPVAAALRNPQTLLGAVGQGAVTGAVSGALQPVVDGQGDYWTEKPGKPPWGPPRARQRALWGGS